MAQDKISSQYTTTTHEEHSPESRHTAVTELPYVEHRILDQKVPQDDLVQAKSGPLWSRIRHQFREPLSEFWGTFILVLFGDGVNAQVVLSGGTKGDWLSISWGWGYVILLQNMTRTDILEVSVSCLECILQEYLERI